jgi:hypothetical protein
MLGMTTSKKSNQQNPRFFGPINFTTVYNEANSEVFEHISQDRLKKTWIQFLRDVIGEPTYSFTLTMRPVSGTRRTSTKINDAVSALSWFVNVLNTRCFGHGYRRQGIELGFFAALEGLGQYEQPHWHGVIRLPAKLTDAKFLKAFEQARRKTKRLGSQFDLQPYYEKKWLEYTIKTGVESVHPEFIRVGAF